MRTKMLMAALLLFVVAGCATVDMNKVAQGIRLGAEIYKEVKGTEPPDMSREKRCVLLSISYGGRVYVTETKAGTSKAEALQKAEAAASKYALDHYDLDLMETVLILAGGKQDKQDSGDVLVGVLLEHLDEIGALLEPSSEQIPTSPI